MGKKRHVIAGIFMAGVMGLGMMGCSDTKTETTQGGTDVKMGQTSETSLAGTKIRFAVGEITDEKIKQVWEELIADYEEKSGVDIEFEIVPGDFRVWLTTQHTANNAPDVLQTNYNYIWEDYAKGYMINFDDYIDEPNPYNENKTIRETMADSLLLQAVNPDDNSIPAIPSHVVGTKIIYNKNMFEEAGITEVPVTYDAFMEACKKLQEKGHVPVGFANSKSADVHMNWWIHTFVAQMDQELRDQMDKTGDGFVSKNELVEATDQGLIDFTKDPFRSAFELLKDFSQYWNSDFNSTDQEQIRDLWMSEKIAMYMTLSSSMQDFNRMEELGFDYGIMNAPILTEDNYPNVTGKSLNNGGRMVTAYGITQNADEKKQAASIDFVNYMMSPDVLKRLMNEFMYLPPLADMELSDELQGWLTQENEDTLRANYFGNATFKEFVDFQVLSGQLYLGDELDLDTYLQELNQEWKAQSDKAKAENGWSEENEYGRKKEE